MFTGFNYCFWRLCVILYVCSAKNVHRHGEGINVGLNLKLILTTSLLSPFWFPTDFSRKWMLSYVGNLFKHNVNWNDCFNMTKYGHNKSLKTVCLIIGSYTVDLFQTCWVSCTNPVQYNWESSAWLLTLSDILPLLLDLDLLQVSGKSTGP